MDKAIRYPIGEFQYGGLSSAEQCAERLLVFRNHPAELRAAVKGLSESQLDTPHREGGWTVRQIVHHLGDANIHFYCRTKATVTEEKALIVGFEEDDWIKMPDIAIEIEATLSLLDGLHRRWDAIMSAMKHADFARTFMHNQNGETILDRQLAYAAWHCRHHVAQINAARKRYGW